ncbi:uncharacterized protein LOC116920627 [Daphnia magna]|uniref:uncharacterized protein LOC116920627 n=1 Tax=Daphnia magna TaxID=35525 RepID=UPI001E1BA1FA|nr:uncharacterized protein LOC116920627 [Daphnia magna]
MNEFGSWLCLRASAYQNAYSIASDQSSRPSGSMRPGQSQQQMQLPHQHADISSERIAFGVIQLEALNQDGELIPITVILDPGSNATLFREGIVRSLKLRGRRQTLHIDGVADTISSLHSSEHLEMQIRTAFGELVTLEGSTLPSITRPVPFFRWEDLRKRWRHLEGLPELLPAGGKIDVLIGLNHAAFTTATESRIGNNNEPTAEKTRLGWILKGVVDGTAVNVRVHQALASTDIGCQLLDQMRRFCDTETFGTEYQIDCISPENKAASEFLDRATTRLDIGYEAPILWKDGVRPVLPDNRSLAESRLQCLINKFRKTAPEQRYEFYYRKAMQKNFDEGYACRLSPEETASQSGYYLPNFGVPKIPGQPELRLVYDAAARYRGRCLNDYIVSGPPVQNPLSAVVIRFREGAVAWSADIRAMFSRIRLKKEDRRYHRFLWPEEDGSVSTCEMTRVTFGVSCSPFVAIRTMWRVADDAGPEMKAASEAVRNNLYVDDYLGSARSQEEAISVTKAVTTVLANGDFHLGSWASNDPAVLTALQSSQDENGNNALTTRDLGSDDVETVLGITWRPTTDMLGFRVKEKEVTFTRIGLASMVAGQFDPQGTAAPMTVKGKIRLRELGVRGLGWNETVDENDSQWWTKYFDTVQQLRDVEFPRGLFPNEQNIVQSELHTFADASEEACAAVCYIRHSYQDGSVIVRHVKAATKLAPLKTVSVCKLELTAALLGARLARFVGESMTRKVNIRKFWTDSSTVRNCVRAVSAQYQVYVSHRIGEIQTLTAAHEWRFVPGRLNPADAATRSQLEAEAIPLYWLDGPPFLYADPADWPKDLPWLVEKQEIRSIHLHLVESHPTLATDWSTIVITAKEIPALIRLEENYRSLIQLCQEEAYPEELKRLRGKKPIRPTSRLMALTPFLGDDKMLRLSGRLGRAKLPYDVLHPPILPGPHPLARSIIRAFHEEMHHVGTDFVLSHVRQHFWITAGREAVKRVRNECIPCRRFRPKAALQMMADVHKARLGAREPPFTYTSVDYFGPIDVVHGRRTAKRWGALFTCLVTRALYVDVAVSLSSDDFLLVLRRFASIYRKPAHMFSDNGTNLVGAERILREELERLKVNDGLTAELKGLGINWTFQPAQTPHFGGSHESLVRSVKNALYAALDQEKLGSRKPSDEILRTLLFEVSGLLNARPLTYVSADPDDFRPLTPNDFLNRAPVADLPAGNFSHSLPREHYRYVKRITNLFWDLWHGAFLQSMVGRKKWQSPARNLAIGDFVLDDWKDAPRGRWRTGKISKVYPGADGLVRAVDVQFSTGTLRRGTNQLALLEACSLDPEETPMSSSGEYGAAKLKGNINPLEALSEKETV